MTFSFHPEAEEEFNQAIEYYENNGPGLGYDFSIEGIPPFKTSSTFQLRGRS